MKLIKKSDCVIFEYDHDRAEMTFVGESDDLLLIQNTPDETKMAKFAFNFQILGHNTIIKFGFLNFLFDFTFVEHISCTM